MSIVALRWARAQTTGSGAAKAVLLILADYAGEDGVCWPSQATIAKETELSLRTVNGAMGQLERLRLISRVRRGNGRGGRSSDMIRLIVRTAVTSKAPALCAALAHRPEGNRQIGSHLHAPAAHEPPRTPNKNDMLGQASAKAKGADDPFETAWAAYPP